MTYSIRWGGDPEDVTITFAGVVTVEELFRAFEEVRAAPGYATSMRQLHDHRLVDWSQVTGDDMRRRAQALIAFARPEERHRVAVVVDRKLAFGLMRMREAHSAGEINSVDRVFYDLDEARAWLAESPL
jgi:hypothetical protein